MAVIDFRKWKSSAGYGKQNSYLDDDDDDDLEEESRKKTEDYLDDDIDDEDTEEPHDGRYYFRLVLRVALGLALVAGIIALILLQSRTRVYSSASFRKVADLASQDGTQYISLGSSFVICSRDGASCMDMNGNQVWNITYEMQHAMVAKSGSIIAIGDYNGSEIYILNSRQSLGTVDTNMPLLGLSVSQSGEVAAVLSDGSVVWVYLFDAKGNTIAYFKTTMSKSGYPISIAISPNGEVVGVSHLTVGNATVNSSIAFYNFGAVGQNVSENNVSGFNYDDEAFVYSTYLNDNTCAAVSDKRIAFFTGNEIPQAGSNAMFTENLQGVFSGGHYIALLFPDTSGNEQYTMRVYDASGSRISSISFTMDYTNIQLCGDRIVINNDQACKIYTVNGNLKFDGNFEQSVRAVIPSENSTNRLTAVTDDGIYQMVLE